MNTESATIKGLGGSLLRAAWQSVTRRQRGLWPLVLEHLDAAGVGALPVVLVIAFSGGFVFSMVVQLQLGQLGMEAIIPSLLWMVLSQQLSAVLVGLVMIGRSISAMTAETASMKNSEELKALHITGIDVAGFLFLPRLLALALASPLLVLIADFAGMVGGYIICAGSLHMDVQQYVRYALEHAHVSDAFTGAWKSVIFAAVMALIAFHSGLNCSEGSEGVSKSTTQAVVRAVVVMILINTVLTALQLFA